MIYDGIKLIEGSTLQNLVIATGTSFPSNADEGELFVRTDAGNAGLYVYQNSVWSKLVKDGEVAGGATSVGASGTIQLSNGSGALTSLDNLFWNTSTKSLTVDSNLNINPANLPVGNGGVTGRSLVIKGGTGGNGSTGGLGGALQLYGGSGGTGTTSNAGSGGALQLYGGNAGTDGNWPGNGGWIQLYGGQPHGSGTPGSVAVYTNNIERFRVSNTGAFGLSGANYGASGQVLTSQGANSAPIWTTLDTFASNSLVTLDTTQTITGNKTFTAKILAGHTSSIVDYVSNEGRIQVVGAAGGDSRIHAITYSNDNIGPAYVLMKSRSSTLGSGYAATQAGDATGSIVWAASNGSAFVRNASIAAFAEATGAAGTGVPGYLTFHTAPSTAQNTLPERMRINSVGQVMVGLTAPVTQANASQAGFSVGSTEVGQSRMAVSIFRNDANSAGLTFTKSRGGTAGTHGLLSNGDGLGFMSFEGSTGSAYARGAIISVVVDGTPSSTSMPAKISFYTTPQGSLVPVERFTLTSAGAWSVNSSTGTTGQVLVSNGSASSPTWQDIPNPTKLERVTTFDANARGKRVALSAGITIPAGTYAPGDAFSFYNTTGTAITISQGSSLTLRQDGTPNTGTRTLAAYGTCFVWFNTTNEAIISGSIS